MECGLEKLQSELEAARTKLARYEKLFTTEEQRHLASDKRLHWKCKETLSKSLIDHMTGPKSYELRRNRGFPLPHPRTLQRFTAQLKLQEGFLEPVFDWFRKNPKTGTDRYCVVMYDEMVIQQAITYDTTNQQILMSAKNAQVVVVKGLFSNWIQVIYVGFDVPMTGLLLKEVVDRLEDVGLRPCASVGDLGPSNQGVFTDLGLSPEKPYFETAGGHLVFLFADSPHLLKLVRNHLVDVGFTRDGKTATIDCVEMIIAAQRGADLKWAPGLGFKNIPKKGSGNRMKVSTAAKLLSNRTSAALKLALERGADKMPPNTEETALFIKIFNDW